MGREKSARGTWVRGCPAATFAKRPDAAWNGLYLLITRSQGEVFDELWESDGSDRSLPTHIGDVKEASEVRKVVVLNLALSG